MPSKRPENLTNEIALFSKEYARKAQRGIEPNDRRYDRSIEQRIKQMKPEQLSALLNEDESATEHILLKKEND